jgi:hypothetical protein
MTAGLMKLDYIILVLENQGNSGILEQIEKLVLLWYNIF